MLCATTMINMLGQVQAMENPVVIMDQTLGPR